MKKLEQLYAARDKALEALVEAVGVPAPEGVVRDQIEGQKQNVVDQLDRMGSSLPDYLSSVGKTEEEFEADLSSEAQTRVRTGLVLDAFADENEVSVTEDEYMHEVVHRAERAGVAPQQYYDQMVRAGVEGTVFADIRRGKSLSALLERITIKDSTGAVVSLTDLQQELDAAQDHAGHNHGDDDHEGHDHEGHDHEDHTGHDHD